MPNTITIQRTCPFCGQKFTKTVDAASYAKYQAGAYIQDAFSNLPAAEREEIKTGIHSACWDSMFSGSDEN